METFLPVLGLAFSAKRSPGNANAPVCNGIMLQLRDTSSHLNLVDISPDTFRQKIRQKLSITHARSLKSYNEVQGDWEYATCVDANDEILLH